MKHFCEMGHKEIHDSNAKSTGWGGGEGRKGKMGTWHAAVFLTAGVFALKGPFKSTCCQGRFSLHIFYCHPTNKRFQTSHTGNLQTLTVAATQKLETSRFPQPAVSLAMRDYESEMRKSFPGVNASLLCF